MSDDRLRALERRWRATGAVEDELAYVLERVRAGVLSPADLERAAPFSATARLAIARLEPEERLKAGKRGRRGRLTRREKSAGRAPTLGDALGSSSQEDLVRVAVAAALLVAARPREAALVRTLVDCLTPAARRPPAIDLGRALAGELTGTCIARAHCALARLTTGASSLSDDVNDSVREDVTNAVRHGSRAARLDPEAFCERVAEVMGGWILLGDPTVQRAQAGR